MDTTAVRVAEHRQPTVAGDLIATIASFVGRADITVHALDSAGTRAVPVVDFALAGLPRRVVHRGLGEVLFNEDSDEIAHRGRDDALVAVLPFGGVHAVIDAARGHATYGDENDAYLIGKAHLFHGADDARRFAAQCVLGWRQHSCCEALCRAIGFALPLPASVVAQAMRDALTSAVVPERALWMQAVRYHFDRSNLEVMR